jgi:spermidine synthase
MIATGSNFGPDVPERVDAVLVDIDHTPRHLLHPSHASFYGPDGLRRLADRLEPGGVYALWSDDPPDEDYIAVVDEVFASCEAHVVTFPNPLTGGEAANTVYVGR